MALKAKLGEGRMNVRHVTFEAKSQINFKRLEDHAMERVTTIDRRLGEGEYSVMTDTPLGLYVERTGYYPKLVLWHCVADLDFVELVDAPEVAKMGAGAPLVSSKQATAAAR